MTHKLILRIKQFQLSSVKGLAQWRKTSKEAGGGGVDSTLPNTI